MVRPVILDCGTLVVRTAQKEDPAQSGIASGAIQQAKRPSRPVFEVWDNHADCPDVIERTMASNKHCLTSRLTAHYQVIASYLTDKCFGRYQFRRLHEKVRITTIAASIGERSEQETENTQRPREF